MIPLLEGANLPEEDTHASSLSRSGKMINRRQQMGLISVHVTQRNPCQDLSVFEKANRFEIIELYKARTQQPFQVAN